VYELAGTFATRLNEESDTSKAVARVFRQVLARDPTGEEMALTQSFLGKQKQLTGSMHAATVELVRGMFNLNEFLYVD